MEGIIAKSERGNLVINSSNPNYYNHRTQKNLAIYPKDLEDFKLKEGDKVYCAHGMEYTYIRVVKVLN